MNQIELFVIDGLQSIVERLPEHRCAYCGSHHTVLHSVETDPKSISFSVFCNSCNQIDRPMLLVSEMMKILRAIG